MKTNANVVRASVYSPLFQSTVGPIRGAETKEKYQDLVGARAAAGAAAAGVAAVPAATTPGSDLEQLKQKFDQLEQRKQEIESGPNWRKTITPQQMRERRSIRKRQGSVKRKIKEIEKQEIKISRLYNKIPSVPDKETQNAIALEEILGYSKLPRRFNVDESKKGQPGPVIEISKKIVNVHPDFIDEIGQVFDETRPEQQRKQIFGDLVRKVQTEKQKQARKKRATPIAPITTTPIAPVRLKGRPGVGLKKPEKTKRGDVKTEEDIIKEFNEIALKAEELSKLPAEELGKKEKELKELERKKERLEKELTKIRISKRPRGRPGVGPKP